MWTPHLFMLAEYVFPPNYEILRVQDSGAKEERGGFIHMSNMYQTPALVRASSFSFLVSLQTYFAEGN